MTHDLDVCCRFDPENLSRLGQALADLDPVHRMEPSKRPVDLDGLPTAGFKSLYLETTLGQLDCLSELAPIGDFPTVMNNSDVLDLGSGRCHVLGLEALIRSKEAVDRPRDRMAVAELRAIQERRARPES